MPTTPVYGFPAPALTDPPNAPSQILDLAEAVETEVQRIDALTAGLLPLTPWASFTPTIAGGGSATYSTRTGRWSRIRPKTVAFNVYFIVGVAGSGTDAVTFTLPTAPSRAVRQTFAGHSEGPGAQLQAIVYSTGAGKAVDRIQATTSADFGNVTGSGGFFPLAPGQLFTFSGVYEEA